VVLVFLPMVVLRQECDPTGSLGPNEPGHRPWRPLALNARTQRHVRTPAHVPFDVDSDRRERIDLVIGAPAQEDAQVGLAVPPGQAAVATEVGRYRGPQDELTRWLGTGTGNRKRSHITVRHQR
jgi:hypothetical protein